MAHHHLWPKQHRSLTISDNDNHTSTFRHVQYLPTTPSPINKHHQHNQASENCNGKVADVANEQPKPLSVRRPPCREGISQKRFLRVVHLMMHTLGAESFSFRECECEKLGCTVITLTGHLSTKCVINWKGRRAVYETNGTTPDPHTQPHGMAWLTRMDR
ncbi:hypothetical protein BC832DRAFT_107581 [Gaertneriomyces semiglobifer]|nr:hypothetical protein BC832DRAFT_107581 [Gaertneriomyces semiglobifer]